MNTIEYSNVDFTKLERLKKIEGKNAKLYTEKDEPKSLYKVFNNMTLEETKRKSKKIEIFSEIKDLNSFVNPRDIIVKGNKCKGLRSDFIVNSMTLDQLKYFKDLKTFVKVVINASKDLKKFHSLEGNPVVGDMHFENIIVDDELNHYFIDIDSYGIYDIHPDYFPSTIYSYCTYWNYHTIFEQSTDRLAFMLNFFSLIFEKNFVNISVSEYEELSNTNSYLKELYDIYADLKYSHAYTPDVPYFYEIVKTCKIYDEEKQKSFVKTR